MTAMVSRRTLRIGACLSLTGRYSRFGVQAAHGLAAWRALDSDAELLIEDDGSDPTRLELCLRAMAGKCDLLLGPYSTQLMRTASRVAMDLDRVVWESRRFRRRRGRCGSWPGRVGPDAHERLCRAVPATPRGAGYPGAAVARGGPREFWSAGERGCSGYGRRGRAAHGTYWSDR